MIEAGRRRGLYEIVDAIGTGQTQTGSNAPQRVNVVLNWTEVLKQRVPTR